MQQMVNTDPSAGQSASLSTLSQKRADRSLMHCPLHGFRDTDLDVVVIVGSVVVVTVVAIIVETFVDNDVSGRTVVDGDEILLKVPSLFFSS